MITDSFLLKQLRGHIGNMVIKQYPGKTVVSKVPDMSGIEASPAQRTERNKMKEAVAWAKQTNADPVLKAGYIKVAGGSGKVYQHLVKGYLRKGGPFFPGQ